MFWWLYQVLFLIGFTLMLPRFFYRMWKRGGYRRHFLQRLGFFDADTRMALAGGARIWVHAVSVGELFVAQRFMQRLRQQDPDSRFVLTVTTSTGYALACKQVTTPDVVLYFPVDLPAIMARYLRLLQPRLVVLVEGEYWPNLIRLCHRRAIPVAVVNGRLSERSFRGYRRVRWLTRRVFPLIDGFLMQSEADADRVRQLGAPADRVQVAGSAKYDINGRDAAAEAAAEAALRAAGVPGSATVLLGGSTWPGEEEVLLYVYARLKPLVPELVLALAPRHVERTPEVLAAIAARQLTVVRRSAVGTPAAGAIDVFLLDTTGELKAFYAHADVIFVGKSLTHHGGQNVIEPAVYGKAIVTGPNMENFAAIMGEFLESEAVLQVADAAGLMETVQRLLTDPEAARQLGERAQAVLAKNAGAVDRSVAQLMPLMAR